MLDTIPHVVESDERFTGGFSESPAESLIPALYQALNETTTDAIICKRLTGSILLWNKAAEQLYGYTAEEIVGKHISEIVPPDRIQELSLASAKLHLGQRLDRFHTRRVRKDGTTLYVDVSVVPIRNEAGAVVAALDIARDITAEVNLRENLIVSERRYRELIQNVNSIIVRIHPDGSILFMNTYALKFFGYTAGEVIGRPAEIVMPLEMRGTGLIKRIIDRPMDQAVHEFDTLKKSGERDTILWTHHVVTDDIGRVSELLSIGTDLTEVRRLEVELQESERRFRLAVEHYPFPFGIYDAEYRVEYANPAALRMLGTSESELYGRRLEQVWPGQLSEGIQKLKQEVLQAKESRNGLAEFEWGGTQLSYEMAFVPVLDDRGEISQILGVSRDITPLQDAQKELTTAQKHLEENVIKRTVELERELASLQEVLAKVNTVRAKVEDWTVSGNKSQAIQAGITARVARSSTLGHWNRWWHRNNGHDGKHTAVDAAS